MSMTITQTAVEQRLQPVLPVSPVSSPMKKKTGLLLRSSSFDRLRHIPSSLHAYFCRHGSVQLLKSLHHSRTQISVHLSLLIAQLRSVLFTLLCYGAVTMLSIQLAMCLVALGTVAYLPLGLAFLICCVLAMTAIAFRISLGSDRPALRRPSRQLVRHRKRD